MKIVINGCYGGFSLSEEARKEYMRRRSITTCYDSDIPRDDPVLVSVVEDLGEVANGRCAYLRIEEIDDDYEGYWSIDEYDGAESIAIDGQAAGHTKTARVLYDPTLSDQAKIAKLMTMYPPPPSMLKDAKKEALYGEHGPVEKRLGESWGK